MTLATSISGILLFRLIPYFYLSERLLLFPFGMFFSFLSYPYCISGRFAWHYTEDTDTTPHGSRAGPLWLVLFPFLFNVATNSRASSLAQFG
jgi:hypothetical protein